MRLSSLGLMPCLACLLLVDDNRSANFLNQLLLINPGIAELVLVAEDGQQALTTLAELSAPPALILLDLNISVLNGIDFFTRYAQLPPVRPRPIVALLSSSDQSLDQARTQNLPVEAYLIKLLASKKLRSILQQHFAP